MIVLGIETSGPLASVAAYDAASGRLVASRQIDARRQLVRHLAAAIRELLGSQRPSLIGVGLGPGSFTGLRIGVATGKALAHAWSVPLVGVPSFPAMAAAVGTPVVCLAYARRGWMYAARCETAQADGQPKLVEVSQLAEWLERSGSPCVVAGDGIEALPEELTAALERAGWRLGPSRIAAAEHVARMAAERAPQAAADAAFSLRPLYILPSQAERDRGIDLGLT